jgi:ribose transport system permease protein
MQANRIKAIVLQYGGLLVAIAALVLLFGAMTKNFFTATTLLTVANTIPDITVVAVGMTLVLIAGGIDLSVGSVMAFSGSLLGVLLLSHKWPLALAAGGAVLLGALCGGLNGWISAYFRIPAFIVTLGMLEVARGAAAWMTDSTTQYVGSSLGWISEPLPAIGLSPSFLFSVMIVLLGQWILHRTVLGRLAVAVGTNAESVRMSGISTTPILVSLYCLSGALCGVAAIMQSSKLSTVDPNAGVGMELSAIAACVIGGTSLRGGQGSVISTFFGVLLISILQTGLAQMGISDPIKRMITGGVIILAVLIDAMRKR